MSTNTFYNHRRSLFAGFLHINNKGRLTINSNDLPQDWQQPPAEFSLAPFWFWNDELSETELMRQLDEFQSHSVDAFVLHPRLGLPQHMGWMSRALLDKMRFGIEQAKARGMWVILYDEGMYPSGSSAGQVVAENPDYQCRGMVRINLDTVQPNQIEQGVQIDAHGEIALSDTQTLVAEVTHQGQRYAIVDRPIDSVIRGLHYIDESITDMSGESPENAPMASDLLNPDAVACYIRLVYDRFYTEFGEYFGTVIPAIFTDEPMLLGRSREKNLMPSTKGILEHINAFLGYDFSPSLPALWDEPIPEDVYHDFEQAIEHHFEETYYAQLSNWCAAHHIALTGHPAEPDATRHLRYFQMPGQDIVWRYIEPDRPSALEGRQSTQAKAASSVMLHSQGRRNVNEFCGAYGHDFTFEEMEWLANWLLVRGCNLLIPHAFYYSLRGPRKDERPPDVGLHSPWWDTTFKGLSSACRRLSWLNTDSQHICHVAILGEHHNLPWRAAKACFQNQIDFNYLDVVDLAQCTLMDNRLHIANQAYQVLIVDSDLPSAAQEHLKTLGEQIEIIRWGHNSQSSIDRLKSVLPSSPFDNIDAEGLRIRHVRKQGFDWVILHNEDDTAIDCQLKFDNETYLLNAQSSEMTQFTGQLSLDGYEMCVIVHKEQS